MSINIQGPGTSPTWGAGESQGAQEASQHGWQTVADGMQPSSLLYEMLYTQDAQNPLLPPPGTTGEQFEEPEVPPRAQTSDHEGDFYEIFQGKLTELVEQHGLTESQAKELVFAHLTGTTPPDPQLAEYLTTLDAEVMAEMLSQYPELQEGWQPTGTRQDFKNSLNRSYNNAFEAELAKKAEELGLTPEQVASLRFAHFNPDLASGEEKDLLNEIENNALQSVIEENSLPSYFQPEADSSSYMANLVSDYDEAFLSALEVYAKEHSLSDEHVAQIKYMHYHPDAIYTELGPVHTAIREIEASVLQDLGQEWGFPASFKPQVNAHAFDSIIHGRFQTEFHQALSTQTPPLTQEQINAVINYMRNPEAAVSNEIKAIYDNIYANTIANIKQIYSLPSNWTPQVSSVSLATLHPVALWGHRVINNVEERVVNLQALVSSMPDGPEKMAYINAIKLITEALSTLKELIFLIQMKDSELGQMYAQMQKDATLNKIAENERRMKKMKKKRKKMKTLGPLMDVFKSITYLAVAMGPLMPLGLIAAGPVGLVLIAGLAPIMIAQAVAGAAIIAAGEVGVEKMWEDVETFFADTIGKKLFHLSDSQARVFGDAMKWTVIVGVLLTTMPFNPLVGYNFASQSTTILSDVFKALGVGETTASMIQMSFELALDLVVEIMFFVILTGLSMVFTAGVGTGAVAATGVASVSAKVAATTAKTAATQAAKMAQRIILFTKDVAKELIKKIVTFLRYILKQTTELTTKMGKKFAKEILESIPELLMGAMHLSQTVAQSANQAIQSINRAQLAKIQGDLDAYMEEMQAFIKIIKKIVENLMNGLQGLGSWAQDVGQLQQQLWSGRSATISNVTSA